MREPADVTRGKRISRMRAQRLYPINGQRCPCGAPAIDHHHRDGDALNNVPENVELLCADCHGEAHRSDVCRGGHPRTPENTYTRPNGQRLCRICSNESQRRWRERRRAAHPH